MFLAIIQGVQGQIANVEKLLKRTTPLTQKQILSEFSKKKNISREQNALSAKTFL